VLTLTLKNIPKEVHALLKNSAEKNRRSLNSEILARLEREVSAPKVDRARLARDRDARGRGRRDLPRARRHRHQPRRA